MMKNIQYASLFLLLSLLFGMQPLFSKMVPVPAARFAVFSKNNDQIIYLNTKNQIVKISTRTGQLLKNIPLNHYNVHPFAATPDGFKLLAYSPVGIEVIHNGTGKILRTLPYPPSAKEWIIHSVQNHSGVLLAIPFYKPFFKGYHLIHTGSGKRLHTIDITKFYPKGQRIDPEGFGFSQDRHTVAFAIRSNGKNTLHLYDIFKNIETARIKLPNVALGYNDKLKFSKNGKKILINAQYNKACLLVDTESKTVTLYPSEQYSFAGFTGNDQNLILTHTDKNKISLINLQSGKTTFSKLDLKHTFSGVQSADRSLIALAPRDFNPETPGHFLLIDANTGKLIRQLNIK